MPVTGASKSLMIPIIRFWKNTRILQSRNSTTLIGSVKKKKNAESRIEAAIDQNIRVDMLQAIEIVIGRAIRVAIENTKIIINQRGIQTRYEFLFCHLSNSSFGMRIVFPILNAGKSHRIHKP